MKVLNNKSCVICGFNARRMTEHWFQCDYCGHLEDIRSPNLDTTYNDSYYDYSEEDIVSMAIRNTILWELIQKHTPDIKTLLDYGCGIGRFLDNKPPGFDVQLAGYDLYRKPYTDKSVLEKKYDMVTAFHVLEHFNDPHELLEAIDCDYIMFSIPWGGEKITMGSLWTWYTMLRPGEHKHCFTRKSLNIFLRDYDLVWETNIEGKGQNPLHPEFIVTQIRKRR